MLKNKSRLFSLILIMLITAGICPAAGGCGSAGQKDVIRVAMPYSDNLLEPEDNYYVRWLEERSGLDIEPVIVRQRKCSEYLDALFSQDNNIDIVMFSEEFEISARELTPYRDAGFLANATDGNYFYPNYGREAVGDCGQILWINSGWLKDLGLKVPETTEELREVLIAFRDRDPNGNGLRDETALLSANDKTACRASELLMESYVYNDPYHDRLFKDEAGNVIDAAKTGEYAEGTAYIDDLKREGLLVGEDEDWSLSAFTELINSPEDMVGAFTADSLSGVIYQGNPEILARFMHVAPLKGPEGAQNALYAGEEMEVGAIICASSEHRDEAQKLLDIMMTKEASLIARYGEEGVDWDYSDGTDVSIYGTPSTIVTHNYIWDTPQNKHLNGIGPMNVPVEYLKGVTWNGINSDFEYIDARAQMSYAAYLPDISRTLVQTQETSP
ncbi:MAG: extracellular solute-binding protein [Butyrivibrio sp.]|nr:extracellular solute-binding protein [Butyrivibrio sp.]